MKNIEQATFVAFALLVGASAGNAQRAFRTYPAPNPQSDMGRGLAGLGDVDGDGVPDYAISGNGVTTGGNGAGAVYVYSGASNALLWTALGTGGWVPCPGGQGTTGDFFGFDIERVGDYDGDGIDDLAVGAPFWGLPSGSCRIFGYGQVKVFSAATGSVIYTLTGAAKDEFLGQDIVSLPDLNSDGVADFLVTSSSGPLLIDGVSGTSFFTLPKGATAYGFAGDFNGDGIAWEFALADSFKDQVTIHDFLLGTTTVFNGPKGSAFGTALEYVPGSGGTPDSILVGAPSLAGGAGGVYSVDAAAGLTLLSTGAASDGLGVSFAYGGSADLDRVADDILVGTAAGGYVRIMDEKGALIDDVTGAGNGVSLAWVGPIVANGLDEFLVGDPAALGNGRARLYYGGPAATLNQNLGSGCHQGGGAVPTLVQGAPMRLGNTYGFSLSGAPAFASGTLFLGVSFPAGTPFGPCRLYLTGPIGPTGVSTFLTNLVGNWASPVFSVPLDPNLIGLDIGHQAVIVDPSSNVLIFSNATSSVLGW